MTAWSRGALLLCLEHSAPLFSCQRRPRRNILLRVFSSSDLYHRFSHNLLALSKYVLTVHLLGAPSSEHWSIHVTRTWSPQGTCRLWGGEAHWTLVSICLLTPSREYGVSGKPRGCSCSFPCKYFPLHPEAGGEAVQRDVLRRSQAHPPLHHRAHRGGKKPPAGGRRGLLVPPDLSTS